MKLGICVPYKNREEHLNQFIPHLSNFLSQRNIEHSFYFAHQTDDKLFNRGTMKNIAAIHAFNDGCDYIVWHDIDMLPTDDLCDYSYPTDSPKHIAVNLSKYNYSLAYEQYFGGAVLFTKEQVYKVNGYSNEYWDWGMEDDDLFWRCHFEGLTKSKKYKTLKDKSIGIFNGDSSFVTFVSDKLIETINGSYTISIIVQPEQQFNKVKPLLIGSNDKKFVNYPIFVKNDKFADMIGFSNSRSLMFCLNTDDIKKGQYSNSISYFENNWCNMVLSVDVNSNQIHFYLNGELIGLRFNKSNKNYININKGIKQHTNEFPFSLGYNIGQIPEEYKYFKGKIADFKIFNKSLTPSEIDNSSFLICNYDFSNIKDGKIYDKISNLEGEINDVLISKEDIYIKEMGLPNRSNGTFLCLPHMDEGFNGKGWAKGETTAKNERRFVTEMQQNLIDYKLDGILQTKYTVKSIDKLENGYMINVEL
jgi:hypothetical protein